MLEKACPVQPDPDLEQRILEAASRLWSRGGEKALTMRAVAKAAGTTTPTVYERYRDRDDILRSLRMETRRELFAAVSRARTLRESVERYIQFALDHSFAYEVLFDGSRASRWLPCTRSWPSFNLLRDRLTKHLGGTPRQHTRVMMGLWSLMHGAAMLIIRGRFEGALRVQTVHACVDTCDAIVDAARSRRLAYLRPQVARESDPRRRQEKSEAGNGRRRTPL